MTPEELQEFLDGPKCLQGVLAWKTGERNLELTCAVAQDGITVQGILLRGATPLTAQDRDVMFQLSCEVSRIGRQVPLTRVEWRGTTHVNKLGPPDLARQHIGETHIHRFERNIEFGFNRMLAENLPVAEEIDPAPSSFNELLAFLRETLRIMNADRIMSPPWQKQGNLLLR